MNHNEFAVGSVQNEKPGYGDSLKVAARSGDVSLNGVRLKIPPAVAICPTHADPVSTDGREVIGKCGCRSPLEQWSSKAMRMWKRKANDWLKGRA